MQGWVDLYFKHGVPVDGAFVVTLCLHGFWWGYRRDTLEEAIRYIGDGPSTIAELYAVTEFVEGHPSSVKLADIVHGEWFLADDRRLDMAKVKQELKKGKQKDVEEDLLGEDKPKTAKARGVKAEKENGGEKRGRKPREPIDDAKHIKYVSKKEYREGSKLGNISAMIKKAATVKEFRKLRAKAGMDGDDVGGMFRGFVNRGEVKLI